MNPRVNHKRHHNHASTYSLNCMVIYKHDINFSTGWSSRWLKLYNNRSESSDNRPRPLEALEISMWNNLPISEFLDRYSPSGSIMSHLFEYLSRECEHPLSLLGNREPMKNLGGIPPADWRKPSQSLFALIEKEVFRRPKGTKHKTLL